MEQSLFLPPLVSLPNVSIASFYRVAPPLLSRGCARFQPVDPARVGSRCVPSASNLYAHARCTGKTCCAPDLMRPMLAASDRAVLLS